MSSEEKLQRAVCQFCSRPDDSVQVVCEAKCLLCSRCQTIPGIKKLLVENTIFLEKDDSWRQRNEEGLNKIINSSAIIAESGTCPICYAPMSQNILSLLEGYYESIKAQSEDQIQGKSSLEAKMEEYSPLIPNFLKRFRTTYENSNENKLQLATQMNNQVDLDAEIEQYLNSKPIPSIGQGTSIGNVPAALGKSSSENVSIAARVNISVMLEFTLDCYQGQWSSMVKNLNDSMLTTMMKQCNKKKLSQKTNDYRAKGIIDFLLSTTGNEMPELILFGHLIGLQPKFTQRILVGWGHITSAALVAICMDSCLKSNELLTEQVTSSNGINEFRTKLTKCFHMISMTNNNANNPALNQWNQSNTKLISLKKALKIVQFLTNIRQDFWIMTPITAAMTEYESRSAWTEDSLSKLINVLFYVSLLETNMYKKGVNLFPINFENSSKSTQPSQVLPPNQVSEVPSVASLAIEKSVSENGESQANSRHNSRSNSMTPQLSVVAPLSRMNSAMNNNNSNMSSTPTRSNSIVATYSRRPSMNDNPATRSLSMASIPELKTMPPTPSSSKGTRRMSIGRKSTQFSLNSASMLISQQVKDVMNAKPNNRPELLKSLQALVEKYWMECNTKFVPPQRSSTPKERRHLHHHNKPHRYTSSATASLMEYLSELGVNVFLNKEQHYFPLTFQESIEIAEKQNLLIPINDFLFTLMICWEREYYLLLHLIEKAKLTKLRRNAFTSNYGSILQQMQTDPTSEEPQVSCLPTMTAGEKQAITKLLFFYRNPETKEFQGVDWEEVEMKINSAYFPFTIPRTLLQKTRLELNLLVEHLIKVVIERLLKEENELIEQENERRNILLNYQTNEKMKNLLADYRDLDPNGIDDISIVTPPILALMKEHPESHEEDKEEEGKGNYADRLLFVSLEEANREFIIPHRKIKSAVGSNRTGFVPLSPAYQSTLSLDIPNLLKIDSSLPNLSKYGEYDTLKEQFTAGGMNRGILSPQKGYNSSNVVAKISTHLATINKESEKPKDVSVFVDNQKDPPKRRNIQLAIPNNTSISASRRPLTADDAMKEVNTLMSDNSYYENIEKYRKNRIMSTRKAILSRNSSNLTTAGSTFTEIKTAFTTTDSTSSQTSSLTPQKSMKNLNVTTTSLAPNEERKVMTESTEKIIHEDQNNIPTESKNVKDPNLSWKSRIIPYLNLVYSLNKDGNLMENLSNTLIAESSVKFLSMKNGNCTLSALEMMLKTYCKDWQLEYMKILQLSGNPRLSRKGGELLGKALQQNCKLIHINLNSMRIGDLGLRAILEGIISGHGEKHLIRLDLKENNITITSESFKYLGRCINLKFLDLSKNSFTLDKECQWETFSQAIYPLIHSKLEYLSLAYNKIQDQGFQRIINELILTDDAIYFHIPLRVLDVAHCFITNQSKETIKLIIVNSMQIENDGTAYKRAFEYTQKYLARPEYDDFAIPKHERRLHIDADQMKNLSNNSVSAPPLEKQKSRVHFFPFPSNEMSSSSKQSDPHPIYSAHDVDSMDPDGDDDDSIHRTKFTDQMISRVFFKPEMIQVVANISRNKRMANSRYESLHGNDRKDLNLADDDDDDNLSYSAPSSFPSSPRSTTSAELTADTPSQLTRPSRRSTFFRTNSSLPSTAGNNKSDSRNKKHRSRTLKQSFTEHLNNIVYGSENLILVLNNIRQQFAATTNNGQYVYNDAYQHLVLNSYYILTNLQTILLHGNVITQHVWDEIHDYQQRSTMQLLYHEDEGLDDGIEYGNGIEDITCYELKDYDIELHAIELAQL